MKNVAIGVRLALGFVAMLALTGAVAGSGYWGMDRISRVTFEMLATDAKIARVAEDALSQLVGLPAPSPRNGAAKDGHDAEFRRF